jgi:acetyl esterase/lipase
MISPTFAILLAQAPYLPMRVETYCTVDGKPLTMNVFMPAGITTPTPAMVEIHGGWFVGGGPMGDVPGPIQRQRAAFFSIQYRLGDEGGFPQCIRDCRNAIRFIRKNADRFHIDPNRIACMGGSAGGHLSLMVAMVPEKFNDGGPTPGLEGVSARVCGSFSWIPPTDFVKFWNQGPRDEVTGPDGKISYRSWNDGIPNDSRPHLRRLFHGISPDSEGGAKIYTEMSPIGHVNRRVPPLLICDGDHDPIVPGREGQDLYDKLRSAGADATYWHSDGGHAYPNGDGFDSLLDAFLGKIFHDPR